MITTFSCKDRNSTTDKNIPLCSSVNALWSVVTFSAMSTSPSEQLFLRLRFTSIVSPLELSLITQVEIISLSISLWLFAYIDIGSALIILFFVDISVTLTCNYFHSTPNFLLHMTLRPACLCVPADVCVCVYVYNFLTRMEISLMKVREKSVFTNAVCSLPPPSLCSAPYYLAMCPIHPPKAETTHLCPSPPLYRSSALLFGYLIVNQSTKTEHTSNDQLIRIFHAKLSGTPYSFRVNLLYDFRVRTSIKGHRNSKTLWQVTRHVVYRTFI